MRRRPLRIAVAALVAGLSLAAGVAVGGAAPNTPEQSPDGADQRMSEDPDEAPPAPSAKGEQEPAEEGFANASGGETREVNEMLLAFDFSLDVLLYNLGALVLSWLFAFPVAWDREQRHASPGLRTFPLVAISSCAFLLVANSVLGGSPDAHSRIMQGLVTGIGFIGGGAILKSEGGVSGTATAASIWAMGAMGCAVAYRRLEIALLLTVVTFATLRWLQPFKRADAEE